MSQRKTDLTLTGKLDLQSPQTSFEVAHTYAQESKKPHNSLNTWPSKTLKKKQTYKESSQLESSNLGNNI